MSVDTVPSGKPVEVDGQRYTAPVTLSLPRKRDHVVVAYGDDGTTTTRTISAERDLMWHVWDVLWFPIVWNVPDIVTGADKELTPKQLTIPINESRPAPEW